MKKCVQCKKNKKNVEFYVEKHSGRLQVKCKECTKKNARASYKRNKKNKKKCGTCKITKNLSEFHAKTEAHDGKQTVCKSCKSLDSTKKYLDKSSKKNPKIKRDVVKPPTYSFEKYCLKCDTVKNKEEFNKNVSTYDGLQAYCKKCQREDNRRTYKARMKKLEKKQYNKAVQKVKEKQIKDDWKNHWEKMKAPKKKSWVPNWLYDLIIK